MFTKSELTTEFKQLDLRHNAIMHHSHNKKIGFGFFFEKVQRITEEQFCENNDLLTMW